MPGGGRWTGCRLDFSLVKKEWEISSRRTGRDVHFSQKMADRLRETYETVYERIRDPKWMTGSRAI